jgi:voltage-gated potassium channel
MYTGIATIDEQHRMLVRMVRELQDSIIDGRGRDAISKVFDDLLEYTVYHFETEERLMKENDYPGCSEHIREHQELTQKVLELNQDKSYVFTDSVIEFLVSWLKHHILESDKELGKFLVDLEEKRPGSVS